MFALIRTIKECTYILFKDRNSLQEDSKDSETGQVN